MLRSTHLDPNQPDSRPMTKRAMWGKHKRLKRMEAKISVFLLCYVKFRFEAVGGSLLMLRASIVSNEMLVVLEMWTSTIAPCLDKLSLQLQVGN